MGRVMSGFDSLRQAQERDDSNRGTDGGGNFIDYLRLKDDGDKALFRIVSEHNEEVAKEKGLSSWLVSGQFHNHQLISKNGNAYWTDTLCGKEEDGSGNLHGECHLCDEEVSRRRQFLVWCWVYGIYHDRQNSDPNNPWELGKLGQSPVYKETINRFMVWQASTYASQIESRLQIYNSLTDRDYMRIRSGAPRSGNVRYELINRDPTPLSAELIEKSKGLPDLADIAMGLVRTMDGAKTEAQPQTAYAEVSVPQVEQPVTTTYDDDDSVPF